MSASPNDVQDDVDNKSVDELADPHTADDVEPGSSTAQAIKRGRGRPRGSKNKKTVPAGGETSTTPTVPRKRGRPPKPKKSEDSEEPAPKRPRGRPPKILKPTPTDGVTTGGAADSPAKKKRGRPSKNTAP